MKFVLGKNSLDYLRSFEDDKVSFAKLTAKDDKFKIEIIKEQNSIVFEFKTEVKQEGSVFVVLNKLVGTLHQFKGDIAVSVVDGDRTLLQFDGTDGDIKITLCEVCWKENEMKDVIASSWESKVNPIFEIDSNEIEKFIGPLTKFAERCKDGFSIGFSSDKKIYLTDESHSYSLEKETLDTVYFSEMTNILYERLQTATLLKIVVSEKVLEFKFADFSVFTSARIVCELPISRTL